MDRDAFADQLMEDVFVALRLQVSKMINMGNTLVEVPQARPVVTPGICDGKKTSPLDCHSVEESTVRS